MVPPSAIAFPTATRSARAAQAQVGLRAALDSPRIRGLDFLRACSILFVLLAHATEDLLSGPARQAIGGLGGLGVEIFFVLSGFLITWMLLGELDGNRRIDYLAFYRRRIARLMPVFYLYLFSTLGLLLLQHKSVPWGAVWASLLYVINYYQALNGAPSHFLSHCWSLAVEEQFYLFWPVVAGVLAARRISFARALVFGILAVWAWRWWLLQSQAPVDYLYRALDTRGDHLAIGCLAAVLARSDAWCRSIEHLHRDPLRPVLVVLLLAGLYCSTLADGTSPTYKYGVGFMIEPLMIAMLIPLTVLGASGSGAGARILNLPLAVEIGKVSYGMYLFHGLVMFTAIRIVSAATGSFAVGFVCATAILVLFCSVLFRVFEMPIRRRIASAGQASSSVS